MDALADDAAELVVCYSDIAESTELSKQALDAIGVGESSEYSAYYYFRGNVNDENGDAYDADDICLVFGTNASGDCVYVGATYRELDEDGTYVFTGIEDSDVSTVSFCHLILDDGTLKWAEKNGYGTLSALSYANDGTLVLHINDAGVLSQIGSNEQNKYYFALEQADLESTYVVAEGLYDRSGSESTYTAGGEIYAAYDESEATGNSSYEWTSSAARSADADVTADEGNPVDVEVTVEAETEASEAAETLVEAAAVAEEPVVIAEEPVSEEPEETLPETTPIDAALPEEVIVVVPEEIPSDEPDSIPDATGGDPGNTVPETGGGSDGGEETASAE